MPGDLRETPNLLIPVIVGGVLGAAAFSLIYPDPEWLVLLLFPGEVLSFQAGGALPAFFAGVHYAIYGFLIRIPDRIARRILITLLLMQLGIGAYLLMWAGAMPH